MAFSADFPGAGSGLGISHLVLNVVFLSMFHKGLSSMFGQSTMLLFLFHVPFPQ